MGRGDIALESFANELRFPAGQLEQPLEWHAGGRRALERGRHEMHGAADDLDRHVLTGLRATHFLHPGHGFTVALSRSRRLALGFRSWRRGGKVAIPVIPSPRRCGP
jgi:hypothetical protein